MSKTPAIDTKTMHDLVAEGAEAKNRAVLKDNPLAALVEEFREFDDIAVSPSFRSLKIEADEAVSVPGGAESPLAPSAEQAAAIEPAQPEINDLQPTVLPTDLPTATPTNLGATPPKTIHRITTEANTDPLAMPSRKGSVAPASASLGVTSTRASTPKERKGMRGLAMAAVALFAVAGAGYLYVQGTQTASSETVVYSVPVFDDEASVSAQTVQPKRIEEETIDKPMEVAELMPQSTMVPDSGTPAAPKPLGFNDSLSDEYPALEGQSLLDLATGVPTFSPSEIVPDSEWQDVSCGGCHSFDQADLCKQGAYYFNHDKARLNRIQHPYGGGYKVKLMEWAEGGCN